MLPSTQDLTIRKGQTFRLPIFWESEPFITVPIASINRSASVQIVTQAPHGMPDGWRAAVVDAQGLTDLNAKANPPAKSDFRQVRRIDATTIEFNGISSAGFKKAHVAATGFVQFYTPHDLSGYTARMSIKDKVGGTELLSLTTDNGGIEIDESNSVIWLVIDAADAAAIAWKSGGYDLELVAPDGTVTAILTGKVAVVPEFTT